MSGGVLYLSLTIAEGLADEIGILYSHVEERTFPGGEVMRHGSLVEMVLCCRVRGC